MTGAQSHYLSAAVPRWSDNTDVHHGLCTSLGRKDSLLLSFIISPPHAAVKQNGGVAGGEGRDRSSQIRLQTVLNIGEPNMPVMPASFGGCHLFHVESAVGYT